MDPDHQAGGVLRFWFEELEPKQWWKKDPELDDLILSRYGKLQRRAVAVELHSWRNSAKGRLAEIILLDQFSRNIFRNTPLAYVSDPLALGLAQEAISTNADKSLEPQEQTFLYIPFMHSESIEIQNLSIRLFQSLGLKANLDSAFRHWEVIKTFGRFPHRNCIVGRVSTKKEETFLKQPGSSF